MSVRFVEAWKGLTEELSTRLSPQKVERRYAPYFERAALGDETKISVSLSDHDIQNLARSSLDSETVTFIIALQQSVGDQVTTDVNGNMVLDGVDDLSVGDEILEKVQAIMDLWRGEGPLRQLEIAGYRFTGTITNDPPFEPLHLLSQGIFSAIIDVQYRYSGD